MALHEYKMSLFVVVVCWGRILGLKVQELEAAVNAWDQTTNLTAPLYAKLRPYISTHSF